MYDCRGMVSSGGCQYPEWMIDIPDVLRLANDGYMREIDRQMASSISLTDIPFGKAHDNTR